MSFHPHIVPPGHGGAGGDDHVQIGAVAHFDVLQPQQQRAVFQSVNLHIARPGVKGVAVHEHSLVKEHGPGRLGGGRGGSFRDGGGRSFGGRRCGFGGGGHFRHRFVYHRVFGFGLHHYFLHLLFGHVVGHHRHRRPRERFVHHPVDEQRRTQPPRNGQRRNGNQHRPDDEPPSFVKPNPFAHTPILARPMGSGSFEAPHTLQPPLRFRRPVLWVSSPVVFSGECSGTGRRVVEGFVLVFENIFNVEDGNIVFHGTILQRVAG